MIDQNEITRALKLWFRPGDVFEVRVLEAVTAEYMRPHVESGYFDFEHIEAAAEALAKLRGYRGAYVTVNPVNPDLLARAVNRLRSAGREPATSDADILRRRWLLVDCDAVRPAGISSSEEEHSAALEKAREIRSGLSRLGWPEPMVCDSGNGAQLMYRIDLPADDGGLVSRCLAEIAKASDDRVKIDLTVHNPARIWRIPGTMNCKGDSTEARSHRMAKLLSAPEPVEAVPTEKLEEMTRESGIPLQNECRTSIAPAGRNNLSGFSAADVPAPKPPFEIDTWIRQYAPELGKPRPWQGGRRWVFDVCPFNEAHNNRSAVLLEMPDGAIAFSCLHNGCADKDWKALRALREPPVAPRQDEKPKLEIILPPEPEIIRPWRDITGMDIKDMLKGTYLGELASIYSCVTRPPLPIEAALLKAIVTAACCLTGEASTEELQRRCGTLGGLRLIGADRAKLKINTAGGQVCNVYAMIVANSASGKDIGNLIGKFARMTNPDIRNADGERVIADWNLGTSGSAEGLANILIHKPNGLLTISEMANWLDPHHWQNKATGFLTETFSQGYYAQNFSERGRGTSNRSVDYCCPNIIANIQPKTFERLVHMQDIDTGFLGRFIFAVMPEFYGNPAYFDSLALMEQMHVIVEVFLRKRGFVELEEDYSDALQKVFLDRCDPKLNPSWRRLCNEYYPRFMVMLSVNRSIRTQGENVIVTDEAKDKAKILTMWFFAQAEKMLTNVMDDVGRSREVEQNLKRIFEIIRDQDRGDGVLTGTISRYATGTGTTSGDRSKLLAELMERQWIKLENGKFSVWDPPPGMARAKVRKRG